MSNKVLKSSANLLIYTKVNLVHGKSNVMNTKTETREMQLTRN